jgi:Rad4 beta-hairpin domain 3
MLPAGAAYIPRMSPPFITSHLMLKTTRFLSKFIDKGAAKIARQLGFDYAEAVVRI